MTCENCQKMHDKLLSITEERNGLTIALGQAHAQIGRLKADRPRKYGESDGAEEVMEVLEFWRTDTASRKTDKRAKSARLRSIIAPGSARYKRVAKVLEFEQMTVERCKAAIRGSRFSKWHLGENRDGGVLDDVQHIFTDEQMAERLEAVARNHFIEQCRKDLKLMREQYGTADNGQYVLYPHAHWLTLQALQEDSLEPQRVNEHYESRCPNCRKAKTRIRTAKDGLVNVYCPGCEGGAVVTDEESLDLWKAEWPEALELAA